MPYIFISNANDKNETGHILIVKPWDACHILGNDCWVQSERFRNR